MRPFHLYRPFKRTMKLLRLQVSVRSESEILDWIDWIRLLDWTIMNDKKYIGVVFTIIISYIEFGIMFWHALLFCTHTDTHTSTQITNRI
jgi:hypothetical protein